MVDEGADLDVKFAALEIGMVFEPLGFLFALAIGGGLAQSGYLDPGGTLVDKAQLAGAGPGHVDNPPLVERPSVIDSDRHLPAVFQITDQKISLHRQGLVGGGSAVHVIGFTVGSLAPVEITAVPGGDPPLLETLSRGDGVIGFAVYLVRFLGWRHPGLLRHPFEGGVDPGLGGGIARAGNYGEAFGGAAPGDYQEGC